jgi:hypothetical protein
MNKPSNAYAKVRSPLPGEAPAVPEHALPAGLVTDGPTGRSAAVADTAAGAGDAAERAGLAADAAWSGSLAEATDGAAAADGLAGEQSLSYSADEAAWLFGLERVAPTLAQAPRSAGAVEAGASRAAAPEPSSAGGALGPELAQPPQVQVAEALAEGPALAEPDVATPALTRPTEEPGASPDRSRTDALSAEVTAALLPALDPGPQAPQAAALDDAQALPLGARQTLHLHSLGAMPTPRTAEAVSLEQQITPPRGTVAYAAGHGPGQGLGPGPVPGSAGQPGAGETTASLLLPANPPSLLTLIRPGLAQPGDGLRRAAGSLLANLGMGLLGGLLALGGAAAVLSLRGERTRPQAAVEPAPPGLDAATRTRLLQQVAQALASGRRPVALALLREYAAASPEPAVEELIRILEREPR